MHYQKEVFKLTREFKAPKELVFKAFSDAEALGQWWGPAEMPIKVVAFDFEPNGKFHYKMEGSGNVMWGLFVYKNIRKYDLIEYVSSFSDESANVCKAPFGMDFPLEIYNKLTLSEINGLTTISLEGYPVNATEAQVQTFFGITDNMTQGFSATFNQLEIYLTKTQNNL